MLEKISFILSLLAGIFAIMLIVGGIYLTVSGLCDTLEYLQEHEPELFANIFCILLGMLGLQVGSLLIKGLNLILKDKVK